MGPRTTTRVASDVATRILDLFYSRQDTWPYQWYSRERQIGGYSKACQHRPPWIVAKCPRREGNVTCGKCPEFLAVPITARVIDAHLAGILTAGSYQLGLDGTSVRWACLDFDDHGQATAQELQDAATQAQWSLAALNLPSVAEASGGSGWRCHLWVFFSSPVQAIRAKVLLDAALRECGLHEKPFIERFPKQVRALGGYGNLVKIPFGIHRKTGERSCFLDESFQPVRDVATALGMVREVDPVAVDMTIDLRHLALEEPTPGEVSPVKNFDLPADVMTRVLSRCEYFREVERRQLDERSVVHYEDWWNYVLMFSRFGQPGIDRIVAFSRLDDRFDQEYTLAQINYIRAHGYHAPSCRRLRSGPGQVHCPLDPLDCGAA